jgi:hypothetical protein
MDSSTLRARLAVAVTLGALAAASLPAAAQAAGKPVVTTGAAADVAQQTATLAGTAAPNGAATTYFFQYGTTSLYGASTVATALPRKMRVTAPIGGLAPATTYHYRLVAQNRHGITKGKDRTFKTRRQPLGVVLAATPNPVLFGAPTTLGGTLTGTGNAGRSVVLQANPFPYTQGFANVTNAQVTNPQGGFSFPLLSVPLNTQYRVLMTDRPDVVSPIVPVSVAVRVTTHTKRYHASRGVRIRFSGIITPARDGAQFAIQRRLRDGTWKTIGGSAARHRNASTSRYSKRVRIRRTGSFRVFVGTAGDYTSNVGRTVRIRVHR